MDVIYHIATTSDWEEAQRNGEYRTSTRGRSLDDVGFIHASAEAQVAPVANMVYHDDDDLLVLVVDLSCLHSAIRYENVPGWETPFPHIYGALNTDAVVRTLPLKRDAEGRFYFTAGHQ